MNEITSIVSLVFSGVMMLIAIITVAKNYGNGMAGQGRIEQKVNDIGTDVKEVRDEIKTQSAFNTLITERVAKVEESAKSAHLRIDGIEEKINK